MTDYGYYCFQRQETPAQHLYEIMYPPLVNVHGQRKRNCSQYQGFTVYQ